MENTALGDMTWFPAADDYLMICSPSGRILFVTSSLRFQLEEDLVGRSLNDIFPDSLAAQIVTLAHEGQSHSFHTKLQGKAVRCSMTPKEGNMLITVFFSQENHPPAMALSAAELLSREISSSLGTMFAAWDALPPAQDQKSQYAKSVLRQGMYRLMRMGRNLLDCARAESGQLELNVRQGDLGQLVRQLCQRVEPMAKEIGIPFSWDCPEEPLSCPFDRERVERVILGLISNSMKYTRQKNQMRLVLTKREDNAVIILADRGRGIPASVLPHLFSRPPESSLSRGLMVGGAGYSLMLARAVMLLHGGTCVISSVPDEGTTVTLSLPLHPSTPYLSLGAPPPDYASGFDHVLLELSTALPASFYKEEAKKSKSYPASPEQ